ncbi:PilW family protein [Dyella acidisoli]|uniref:PilW family protein n=1 Tax=Dyella acidisoli TaxID=1867834 RepID=UPI0024E0A951|nr:PilW family protein [Dyella acidisoli]
MARKRPHQQGFSLIELMVGLVVSMLCMLAIMAAFAVYEGKKRTTTTTNDAQQNGSYAMYVLERQLRTAGASIVQGYNYGVWGCPVTAYTNGTQTLPISGALPAPFKSSGWPASTLLMPVLIAYGGGSTPDTIGVVGGNPAMQVFKIPVTSVPSTNSVAVSNSLGILSGDYVLGVLSNGNCALAHVPAATPTTQVAGTTFTLDTTNSPPNGLQTANYLFDFGSSPAFTLFGIDTSSLNLVSYDLLQRPVNGNAAAVTPLAEGVVQMKALYGVQQAGSSSVQWVQPTGTWSIATLTASASAASNAMKQIKAIRVAIVVQSRLPERSTDYTSGQPTLTLFPDLPSVQYIVTTSTQYRYKVYDTTIPVRNALVAKYY